MALQTAADVPLRISSANSSSERRISPAWSLAQFKTRLEPITGIPASSQRLTLKIGSQDATALEANDEDATQLATFPLQAYAEIYVSFFPPACLSRLARVRFLGRLLRSFDVVPSPTCSLKGSPQSVLVHV